MRFLKNSDFLTPLLVFALIFTFGLTIAGKLTLGGYGIIIFIVVGAIAFSGLRNKIIFKLGTRNILRRRRYSAIIISGLMIGTVIIASSLIIGDTMDSMIVDIQYSRLHEVDEVVYGENYSGSKEFIPLETLELMQEQFLDINQVEAVTGEIETEVAVANYRSGQTEPNFMLVGYDPSSTEFGYFHSSGQKLPMELEPGELYLDAVSAEKLDALKGDVLTIFTMEGPHSFRVREIVDDDGRAGWVMGRGLYMPLSSAQYVLNVSAVVNTIKITNEGGVVEGEEHCELVVAGLKDVLESSHHPEYSGLEVRSNKADVVEQGRENVSNFSNMFLIFGSFSIIAGIVLIINIFVMLAEERKGEMGISRAIGMKRRQLSRSYLYEGSVYSIISSAIGAVLGIGASWAVLYFTESIFSDLDTSIGMNILGNFSFRTISILQAFTFGMMITLITVSFASKRVSRLNIVRAIRNIPEPLVSKKSQKLFIFGFGLMAVGAVLIFLAYRVFSSYECAALYSGVSFVLIGIGFVLRRFIGDRWGFTVSGLLIMAFWIIPGSVLNLIDDLGGEEMFVLAGIFLVSSAVVVFLFNSRQLLGFIIKLWSLTKRPTATLKMSTSYPMKNRFRTGMTIFMFALIIFTVTVMYMIVGIMGYNMERITSEQMGGIDIMGFSNSNNPIDDVEFAIEENENISMSDFKAVYSIHSANVGLNVSVQEAQMEGGPRERRMSNKLSAYGFDDDFASSIKWTFDSHLAEYANGREVWEAVYANSSLVILDYSFIIANNPDPHNPPPVLEAVLGENVELLGPDGMVYEKKIVGFLEQYIFSGMFMSKEATSNEFNVTQSTVFFFDVQNEGEGAELTKLLEKELHIETIELQAMVDTITGVMEQFFNLFTAFMSLGLVVGIAGLGIVTLRAVHERRQEIGMMRAIGFKRHQVTFAFIQEASFISLTGIILGVGLGIIVGYSIWYDGFEPLGYVFYIPWIKIFVVSAIAFISTAIITLPPSYAASRVAPAEALRYD